jgi:hypothetical protein
LKINIVLLKRLGQTILFLLTLLSALTCKKNPIIPNAEELTRPIIWLNTFELSFTAYESGGNPAAQVFEIKNSGKNTLQYTLSDDADWLTVEPASGTSSGQLIEHTILVNKAGLAARDADYEATIRVVSPEAYNNPQRVLVKLNLSSQPPPEIWVSPLEMVFAAKVGKNPSVQTLRIRNAGEGTLTYDIAWDAPWLNVSPTGGSSGGEEKSHAVSVDSKSLPEGSYVGIITVSSADASNSPRGVRVSLNVGTVGPIPTDNQISISCNPSSAVTGTLISVPVSIRGNLQSISSYGLDLNFDSNLFQYVGTSKGSLTGGWAMVDGYISGPGTVTIGGFSGSGNSIPVGSIGSIAVVTLRVTGAGYSDGHQSQITISGYTDDLAGLTPQPASATFTYRQ